MKATKEQVFDVIKKCDIASVNLANLSADLPLRKQGMDSLDMATIFFNLEEAFKVTIPDTDYERLKSVNEIVAYLNKSA